MQAFVSFLTASPFVFVQKYLCNHFNALLYLALKSGNRIGLINLVQLRERWPSLVYAKRQEDLADQLYVCIIEKNKRKTKAHL